MAKNRYGYRTYQKGGLNLGDMRADINDYSNINSKILWDRKEINNEMTRDDFYKNELHTNPDTGWSKYRALNERLNPKTGEYDLEDYYGDVTPEGSHMMEPVYAEYQQGGEVKDKYGYGTYQKGGEVPKISKKMLKEALGEEFAISKSGGHFSESGFDVEQNPDRKSRMIVLMYLKQNPFAFKKFVEDEQFDSIRTQVLGERIK